MTETSCWETGRLYHLNPATLLVDGNYRTIGDLEADKPETVTSIRRIGVKIPILACPTDDGRLRVWDGSCRCLIAVQTNQDTVPVLVTDATVKAAWQDARDQYLANELRHGLPDADKARLFEDLTLFGLSPQQVAEELSADPAVVEAGLRARHSQATTELATRHPQLDMFQLAALAEFDDDASALNQLRETLESRPDQFDHVVSRLRHDRRERDYAAELARTGVTVVDRPLPVTARALDGLRRGGGDPARLDAGDHASCPGHAAYVTTVDGQATARYVCLDWRRHGHTDAFSPGTLRRARRSPEEKAVLRRVVAHNKAWRAATPVRREFVARLLRRCTPPKQAHRVLTEAWFVPGDRLRRAVDGDHSDACALLDLPQPRQSRRHPLAPRAKATVREATMTQLALVLAAFEHGTSEQSWRHPTAADRWYFGLLQDWGYALSPVERLVLDANADAADWPDVFPAPSSIAAHSTAATEGDDDGSERVTGIGNSTVTVSSEQEQDAEPEVSGQPQQEPVSSGAGVAVGFDQSEEARALAEIDAVLRSA